MRRITSRILAHRINAESKPDSGLRRLLPKPLAAPDTFDLLAPPPTFLQSLRHLPRTNAFDHADLATSSARHFGPAQRGSDRVKQAGTAKVTVGLRRQGHQNGGVEGTTHPNPKIPINRVQKPEQRRVRGPKTPVACNHCRSVVKSHYTKSTDTKHTFQASPREMFWRGAVLQKMSRERKTVWVS